MHKAIVLALLASSLLFAAQETRREVVHPPNPAQDAKPNSDQVPDVSVFNSEVKRIVVLRFKYNVDLLAELERLVRNYQVHQVGGRDFPIKDVYVKNSTTPADIIGMSGFVIGGRVHAHITLANPDRAFGGHLEPDTTVFTFAIVTIGVLDDGLDLSKIDDANYR